MGGQKFFDTLERRAKRLVQLIDISAPPQMISNEVWLVVQAAMGYCPEEMNKAKGNWLCQPCIEKGTLDAQAQAETKDSTKET